MRHRHRWPYILLLPLLLFLPSLLAIPSPFPAAKTRHHQRQLQRLVGGHMRILNTPDSDDSELIITASAGDDSKNQKQSKSGNEDRKTLSQQVADGKYGLIQKELFKKTPKRPGILSYAPNPEVPKDNIATLGGLTKNDIWLAENHLLVIKGGTYPPYDDTKQDYVGQVWQPIDDYNAPLHQVKIPKNPKIPPPFPVQLTDDGPLQILGTNSSRTLNASAETPAYALPPPPGWNGEIPPQNEYFPKTGPPYSDQADPAAGQGPMRDTGSGEPQGGLPFPPVLLNGSLPPYFAHLPPGAAILPAPQENETDPGILDEDDPSIYYPPPYSFFYPKDNSSLVPPGPLVPGIILPPPPKFFAPLEEEPVTIKTTTPTTRKPTYTTTHFKQHTTTESPLSNEISTQKHHKTVPTRVSVVRNYSKVTVRVNTSKGYDGSSRKSFRTHPPTTKLIKTTVPTTGRPKLITILPVHVDKLNRTYLPSRTVAKARTKPPVTILRPVKPEVATPKVYLSQNEVSDKTFDREKEQKSELENGKPNFGKSGFEYETQKQSFDRKKSEYESQRHSYDTRQKPGRYVDRQKVTVTNGFVSSTQVPLKYYTTEPDIRINSVTSLPPEKFSIGINAQRPVKTTQKTPANLFFYEETDPALNSISTEAPISNQNHNYYHVPNQYYYPDYIKTTTLAPPTRKPTFQPSVKPQYIYVSGRPYDNQKPKFRYVAQSEPRPPSQGNSFSIHIAKLQNQIHIYSTTPKPIQKPSSKPVYQYSFEAQHIRRPPGYKTFRPSPLMDDNEDSFRPIPQYSVEIQPAIEIIPTQQPSYQQLQPLNVEEPTYYSTEKPQNGYNQQYYQEVPVNQGYRQPTASPRPQYIQENSGYGQDNSGYGQDNNGYNQDNNGYGQDNNGYVQETPTNQGYVQEPQKSPGIVSEFHNSPKFVVTPSKPLAEFTWPVTPNPISQGYYTKPDEGLFDENTKQYFTIFGRKLPSATTPMPNVKRPSLSSTQNGIRQQSAFRYKQEQYERSISLHSDINVNYVKPRPPINAQSEQVRPVEQYRQEKNPPNPEVVKAIEISPPANIRGNKERFIHYQLPGDEGAHFYFLTPQAEERRRQAAGYFYERDGRMRRENRKGEKKNK